MASLEPRVRKLNGYPLQTILWQGSHPLFQADIGVAEQHSHVPVGALKSVAIGRDHQGATNFDTDVIPTRMTLGQTEDAAASCTPDVEMDGLFRVSEKVVWWGQPQGQLKKTTEGIDVLSQGPKSCSSLRWGRNGGVPSRRCSHASGLFLQRGRSHRCKTHLPSVSPATHCGPDLHHR